MAKKLKAKNLLKNRDFWVVIFVVVLGLSTGFFKDLFNPSTKSNTAYLEIDFGDQKRAFEGEIIQDMSILDAVLASSRGGEIEVKYALINDQTNILKINDHTEDGLSRETWTFYLNGEKIEAGEIHKIKIKSGDRILIKFE
ncbi:MAG: hypothetical protein G01um10142_178 [Parcubacteria group bacterium Gr01-1014_2]|nr:MAG: hypothetical protein G01um10142_178 [Parcubacteria group bacterium Gr01-1014_2]